MRAVLIASGLLVACSTAPATFTARSGTFHYIAMSQGKPVLTGRLHLTFPDDSTIVGPWAIAWLPDADTTVPVGPQVGTGNLVGARSGDSLMIQLNPGNADHNVGLVAGAAAAGYRGKWEWVTFAGPRSGGIFSAIPE
jgi:hypothetical protein